MRDMGDAWTTACSPLPSMVDLLGGRQPSWLVVRSRPWSWALRWVGFAVACVVASFVGSSRRAQYWGRADEAWRDTRPLTRAIVAAARVTPGMSVADIGAGGMRLFQHYTLGTRIFSQTYELPAEIETDSFLHTHDRSKLNDEIRGRLLQPTLHLAGLTARPSAPPKEVSDSHFGYAPEAEIALELVG